MKEVFYLEKGNKNSTLSFCTEETLKEIKVVLKFNNCSLVAIYDYNKREIKVYSHARRYRVMSKSEWEVNLY